MFSHGLSGYTNYKCKCDVCSSAYREYNKTRRPPVSAEKQSEYQRNSRSRNIDAVRARDARYQKLRRKNGLVKLDPEKDRLRRRKWYYSHRDEILEKRRANNATNLKYVRKYKKTEKGRIQDRLTQGRRRARNLSCTGVHSNSEWISLLAEYDGKCARCGSSDNVTKDHVVPLSLGGGNGIDNIQPLCRACNSSKGNRSSEDYRKK